MPSAAEPRVLTRTRPFRKLTGRSAPPARATIERWSTPEPASAARTTRGVPRLTVRVRRVSTGGFVSPTQKRNVNAPARSPLGLSKTTS